MKVKMRQFGSLFMVIGILLGALGSHYFKSILSLEALTSFEVGVRYLIYHGLGLLLLAGIEMKNPKEKKAYLCSDALGNTTLFWKYIVAFV